MQSMKKPKLFWVSAGAPLLSVIVSTLLVFVFRADRHGISVVSFPLPPINQFSVFLSLCFTEILKSFSLLIDREITRRFESTVLEHASVSR